MPRVVFVTGATATGKSDWALRVAERSSAVIVNCDSIQLYEGLRIGSGLPSEDDFRRVPHHLYGFVKPPREMTAGDYRQAFFERMSDFPEDARVLVVGGTGFYFQALEKGMFTVPAVTPELSREVRKHVDEAGGEAAWAELAQRDPETAAKIPPADRYRLARALELCRSGVIPSELRKSFESTPFPFPLLKVRVDRDRGELRERIRIRARKMIENGLLDEIQGFLSRGLGDWAPLSSVGYKEGVRALRENLGNEWLLEEITLRTAQLAKRQETWFRKDPGIEVFRGEKTRMESGFGDFQDRVLRFFAGDGRLGSP